LNYGTIGSPASSTEAAGHVYRIDPVTGAASVFAALPQQTTTFSHWDCEFNVQEITSTNTGVGLGNIVHDPINDQFFVSNTEDGRIYRLSSTGVILDSYDPFGLDSGIPGIDNLAEVPYGLAVEPGSQRLFFGMVDPSAPPQAQPGAPGIYSVDLAADGSWLSTTIDNTTPSSYAWDNYIGSETLHVLIPTGSGFSYTSHTTYFISDLAFDSDDNLLAGIRVGCHGSWFSSYNHYGETSRVSLNPVSNLYNSGISEFDISVTGDAGSDDSYGGVAVYRTNNSTCQSLNVTTSADVLVEAGPHGITIFDSDLTSAPMSPLGVFSYSVLPNADPKGVGGVPRLLFP